MSAPEASNTRWMLRMTLTWTGGLGAGLTFLVNVWLGILALFIQVATLLCGLWLSLDADYDNGRDTSDGS